ncbi:TonB-dependent receptor [uncultured Microbulbifer sp.]|uniref:TonB-dependent receptor n=1 Tax=uncultured Microbulbifer sp. TaxID=348147 RepID=UPI0025F6E82F|nr:TonB-dependent receptor [uncultured Microbulbifer sp.]
MAAGKKLFACSLLALSITNIHSALAQETDTTLEEVSVTGQRLARMKSLDLKKNSPMIMEALSTDNLGRLPDKNAAESLNRLPGVSILIEKGEGRFASIRGIKPDWNRVTINGFESGSPEKDGSGRSMPLDVLGGELLQSVEVYKAKTADLDGEGIGGTVNIITKKPLDTEGFQATANVRYGQEEADQSNPFYDSEDPHNFDIAASGRISDTVGWSLGASSSHRQYLAQGIYQDDWAETAGIAYPEQTKNNYYVVGRDRNTLVGGVQFLVSENTSLLAQGFYSEFEEFQHRNRFRQGIEQDESLIASSDGDTVTMAEGGTFIRADLRREDVRKTLANFSLSGETELQDWKFSYGTNIGRNELEEPNADWDFRQDTSSDLGPDRFTVNGNGVVEITEGGLQQNQAGNLRFHEVSFQDDRAQQDLASFKFDSEYFYNLGGYESTLKFGIKYASSDKEFDYRNEAYDIQRDNLAGYDVDRGAFLNDVDGQMRHNVWFDLAALNALFRNNPELFEASGGNLAAAEASDRRVEETTSAAYAMNTVDLGKLQLITGVRFETTDVTSSANQLTADGVYENISVSGGNDIILPSLLANYRLRDDLILRAAYTTSIGRPNYADISATSRFSFDEDGDAQLSIGNPDLEPYTADNLDVSLEWYPTESSVVSLAWFDKDIDNIIITDERRIDGGSYLGSDYGVEELTVSTRINADTSDVSGYEFNIQHQFSKLPAPFNGLGASYSFTAIDATFFDSNLGIERKLEGQPEEIQSFTAFYENYGFYAGFTYNYNASFLTDINALDDVSDDVEQGEFGRWDFRASYAATKQLSVYLDINNLNNEPTTEFQGGNESWNTEYEYVGSTYYLGASYTF